MVSSVDPGTWAFRDQLMPLIEARPVRFDVCVVGSGPAGGFTAKELAEAGARTILLEAGGPVSPIELKTHTHTPGYRLGKCEYKTGEDRVGVDRIRVLGGVDAYYTSEIGLVKELRYQGNTYLQDFPGCTHEKHRA